MASSPDIPRDQNLFQTIRDIKKPRTRTDDGWIRVGSTSDEIAPDFEGSWAWQGGDTVPVEFYLAPDGEVRMHGALNDGPDIPSVVFTLPEGYRPQYSERFVGALSVGADTAKIQVDPDGSVWIVSVGYAPGAGTVNPNVLDLTGGSEGDTLTIVSGTAVWQANPAPSPASIVTTETAFGQSSAVGTNVTYARSDHTHGTPTNPITAHVADSDPHTQYQLKALKGATSGYASLDSSTLIPSTQMGTGTPSSSTVLFGDRVWRTIASLGAAGAGASVTSETSFGQSSAVGSSGNFAREDHTHGTPTNPITAHVADSDPHTQYQKESEKNANSGYAGLDSSGYVPIAHLASGTPDGTKFIRDDGTLAVPAGGGGGGSSPATSVHSETTFGGTPDVGTSLLYARGDHTHGTPTDPIPAHVAASNPHTQYILSTQIGALGGVAPLDGTSGLVPPSLLGIGTADIGHYLRGDGVWDSLSSLGGGTGGSVWLTGSGDPDPLDGGNGDMYLRDDGEVFNKVSGSWVDTTINLSAGGSAAKSVLMQWAGKVESLATPFCWRAPYVGSFAKTFTLQRVFARVETPGPTLSTVFKIEKSAGGGAFSVSSTLATITIVSTGYETDDDTVSTTFHSGDLLRLNVFTKGTTGQFQVNMQAIETGSYP